MERILSQDERVRRAEEIYLRRHNSNSIGNINKKEQNMLYKRIKKIIFQALFCLLIYISVIVVKNSNYIFSEQFLNKVNEILNESVDIKKYYNSFITYIKNEENNKIPEQTENNISSEENIGGAKIEEKIENINIQETQNLSQMEIDALNIKNNYNIIKPLEGTITSRFGYRNPTSSNVPKNHTGIDIAATTGTPIVAVLDGNVELSSNEGDYGNHLKVIIDDVEVVYAHCSKLYKNYGDSVKQGEIIAEVGATGNVTGPHLHLEFRKEGRFVNPDLIMEF